MCACVRRCMCVLCVCDMYIQQFRHAVKHTHVPILIQTPMYVEVSNIFVFCFVTTQLALQLHQERHTGGVQ